MATMPEMHTVEETAGTETGCTLDDAARLRAAILGLARRLRSIDAGTGYTPAELSMLATIARRGPIRSSDLASAERLHPTMASRLVHRLADAGMVSRRCDPSDHRGALLELTAQGQRTQRQLRTARARALEAQLRRLPEDERRRLLAALPALEALVALGGP